MKTLIYEVEMNAAVKSVKQHGKSPKVPVLPRNQRHKNYKQKKQRFANCACVFRQIQYAVFRIENKVIFKLIVTSPY